MSIGDAGANATGPDQFGQGQAGGDPPRFGPRREGAGLDQGGFGLARGLLALGQGQPRDEAAPTADRQQGGELSLPTPRGQRQRDNRHQRPGPRAPA